MSESHLNSIHLDFPRREDFRRAREALLGARGLQTLSLENLAAGPSPAGSHTLIQDARNSLPPDANYWLKGPEGLHPLKVGVNTIGRLTDNDVVVPVPYVSRRHCAILVHAGKRCELHDIASKNGTFLNGQRLNGPTPLNNGDEIRMCDREYVFLSRFGDDAEQGAPHDSTLAG